VIPDMHTSPGPGIHQMPAAVYHTDPTPSAALSNSIIRPLLNKSPLHAWMAHPKLNPNYKQVESTTFDLGKACHSLLLEGIDSVVVVDAEDWRTKAAKEARDAARAAGKNPMLPHQAAAVTEMAKACKAFVDRSPLRGFMDAGAPEQTVVWQERVWCRARIDWLLDDRSLMIDYKTTEASNPDDFIRSSMVQYGYDTQDVFYTRGMAALGFKSMMLFLVQEVTPPYCCYIVECAESMREMARRKVQRAIDLWSECIATNTWPAYPNAVYMAEAPMWAMQKEMAT
jgi:hypothetical protein